ncbi:MULTISPECIES: hypothetical protein [Methylobacterium]|jgi:hypothetical protein|uniref:Uncharacterized protein n=1 Tax=Methylobacterium longum TaxID=767694 RepID=A0ABT8ANJ4_9HYPH|nr:MULTISPECIES: hypothetical protein [Methylobacterium]MCJ2103418.1 hypothetical protein [Methylobacterium sp. E-046]MDN3571180.1 hypothetical protein [Methylobacterium longum]GJE09026.1 hypothetical protein FOHLNKBM_0045 [Methylobacterium longum]
MSAWARDRASGDGETEVTFRGRGLALRSGTRLILLVCPLCSQRNAQRGAERGICEWCAYVPSPEEAEPVEAGRG